MLVLTMSVSAQWVTVDSTFPAGSGPDAWVRTLAVQADGRVLIGGVFTNVNGIALSHLARLNGGVNIGVVLGQRSGGLCSLDIDSDDGLSEFVKEN